MQKNRIKKIIFAFVIPLLVLDTTLLYAAQADSTDDMLAQFQQELNQTAPRTAATVNQAAAAPRTTAAQAAVSSSQKAVPAKISAVPPRAVPVAAYAQGTPTARGATFRAPKYLSVDGYMNKKATQDQVEAFDSVSNQAMPMTPDQIKAMRRMMVASQRAAATPAETPAKPVTSSQIVSLAPGATPPVVRLSAGFISTLVFVDATGADWPIASIDNGNPDAFNVSWDQKGNTIMIQAKKAYTFGNVAVVLKGMSTPVMMTLVPGQKEIDYRVDLRVSGLSPDSKMNLKGASLPNTANEQLLQVLDNVPPPDSTLLTIPGGLARGWLADGKIYLRTRYVLLSPGFISAMKSPDGTYAYEIQKTPSILVSQNGKPVELRVKGV